MTSPLDDETRALKIAAVLDRVLSRIPEAVRAVMPMLTPRVDTEFLHVFSGALLLVSIPRWWLDDGDDWLLPGQEKLPPPR